MRIKGKGPIIVVVLLLIVYSTEGQQDIQEEWLPSQVSSTEVELEFSGSPICDNTTCETGTVLVQHSLCDLNGDTDYTSTFSDPIPYGSFLVDVISVNLTGRFYCNTDQPKNTFIALLNQAYITGDRLPEEPSGCDCPQCAISVTYDNTNASMADIQSAYRYGALNVFSLVVLHSMCLSSAVIKLAYAPIEMSITTIDPSEFVVGSTAEFTITFYGSVYYENYTTFYVKIGEGAPFAVQTADISTVRGTATFNTIGTFEVRMSVNTVYFPKSSATITVFQIAPPDDDSLPASTVGTLIAIGVLIVVGVPLAFISRWFIRRRRRSRYQEIPDVSPKAPLVSSNLIVKGDKLGTGSMTTTYSATYKGTAVVVKQFHEVRAAASEDWDSAFIMDIKLLSNLHQPNLVKVISGTLHPPMLITELIHGETLHSMLLITKKSLSPAHKSKIALDVALGMQYLHSRGILHLNLKSKNIMYSSKAIITDYGIIQLFDSANLPVPAGAPAWTAPESMSKRAITPQSDVFSYAVLLWQLHTEAEPWSAVEGAQIVERVKKGERLEIPVNMSQSLQTLIRSAWNQTATARPTFTAIVQQLQNVPNLF